MRYLQGFLLSKRLFLTKLPFITFITFCVFFACFLPIFVPNCANNFIMKSAKVHIEKNGYFRVVYYSNSKRTFRRFKNIIDAKLFAKNINEENTLPSLIQISPEERLEFLKIKKFDNLSNILSFLEKNYLKIQTSKISLIECINLYIEHLLDSGRRERTISDYKKYFENLKKYNDYDIAAITPSFAQSLWNSMGFTISSKKRIFKNYSAFFQFLVLKKITNINPFLEFSKIKILKDEKEIEIYTPEQAKYILKSVEPKFIPHIALMAFAGIRPAEMNNDGGKSALNWNDIDFDKKQITVRAEVAKCRKKRVLNNLPENLWLWLETTKEDERKGLIAQYKTSLFRKEKAKLKTKWIQDGFRHSFASYGYHHLGAEHSVEIMGQESGFAVFAKHYKGMATKDAAKKYFNIKPTKA